MATIRTNCHHYTVTLCYLYMSSLVVANSNFYLKSKSKKKNQYKFYEMLSSIPEQLKKKKTFSIKDDREQWSSSTNLTEEII